jgi:SAM-dependent methyltransferase
MSDSAQNLHWNRHAAQWAKIGSPLRPAAEDCALYRSALAQAFPEPQGGAARVLVLGVTPELASLPFGPAVELVACDHAMGMARHLWPLRKFSGAHAAVLNADWLAMPLAEHRFGVALGDGSLSQLEYPREYRRVVAELQRVLRPGGALVLRLYCRPDPPESADAVFDDLRAGRVAGFHAFKLRLLIAMHGRGPGATLADIWKRWTAEFPDAGVAAKLSGWPREILDTMDAYRDAPARYSFPTLDEVRGALAPEFEFVHAAYPQYELGERCPVVSFRRRAA